MKNPISILIFILLVGACNTTSKENSTDKKLPTSDNSKTALDWKGTYKGVLPCADCEGIETTIELHEDSSFKKKTKYLGKENIFSISTGNFSWDANGNTIYLEVDKPNAYAVGEDQLFALDMNNERITGNMKDLYILKRFN